MLTRRQVCAVAIATVAAPARIACANTQTGKELMLLLDSSGSMYQNVNRVRLGNREYLHYELQRDGHIYAINAPENRERLLQDKVIVRILRWSTYAIEFCPPIHIRELADIHRLTATLQSKEFDSRLQTPDTQHNAGIERAMSLPRLGEKRIIDVSTDEAMSATAAQICRGWKQKAIYEGTDINVLAVAVPPAGIESFKNDLATNGLVIPVATWESYAEALRLKFKLELS